jgi:DNA helicase II / ATP-dependent DNA helicase PcrA
MRRFTCGGLSSWVPVNGMLDLSRLSVEQRHAVLAPDGPLLIVAGPGSGKTTVLAAKIAYLVTWRQIPPTSILALTFATKAARELQERLRGVLGDQGHSVDVSTSHAFGLRIVRTWTEELGLGSSPPAVVGERAAEAVLREVATNLSIDLNRHPLSELSATLERLRLGDERATLGSDWLIPVAAAYEGILRRRGAVDYAAMLALPLRLFSERPGALRLCQDSYCAVLCDEFQDICASQYALLRSLAARHRHVTVVGDPNQILYGWRGADIRFMDEFQRDFPETRVLGLHQNFRSTRQIVACANALGATLPFSRSLWTTNALGGPIRFHTASDEESEAAFVADEIERLVARRIIDRLDEVAILCRTNWQARPFTIALDQRGLPYRSTEGDRAEGDGALVSHPGVELASEDDAMVGVDETVRVTLSTIHRAKGGEWRVVFVVGMEEGLLPHARALQFHPGDTASIDDERRVAYVAVTRAREHLYLTYCRTRRRGDRVEIREPSRFLHGLALERAERTA